MTDEERETVYLAWSLYDHSRQKELLHGYLDLCCGYYSEEGFLAFLKDKLAIEGYS